MNFKNSKTNDTHGQKLDLSNKCDLKRSHKHIALSVRVLITHGEKHLKSLQKTNPEFQLQYGI